MELDNAYEDGAEVAAAQLPLDDRLLRVDLGDVEGAEPSRIATGPVPHGRLYVPFVLNEFLINSLVITN